MTPDQKVLGIPLTYLDDITIVFMLKKVMETLVPKLATSALSTFQITTHLETEFSWSLYITELFSVKDITSAIGGVLATISAVLSAYVAV